MQDNELSEIKPDFLEAALNALQRAAQRAREEAIRNRTSLIIIRNGELVREAAYCEEERVQHSTTKDAADP